MKKRIFMVFLAMTSILYHSYSQVSKDTSSYIVNPLQNLKKAGPGDIDAGTPIMLNPATTLMYFENFEVIKEAEFMKIMMAGDYIPEPYVNEKKEVKAFVFRKATEFEKAKMMEMQVGSQNPNQMASELVGKEANSFSVKDIYSKKYNLEKLKGKIIVANFWFVECKPCVMEMPELNTLVDKYKNKDVVFLGFAVNDKSKIKSFLKTKNFKYNVIADSKKIADLYQINAFPTHIIIDKNSIITYYTSGLGPTTIQDLETTIELLLK
jgi:peroxiredoxin